MEKYTVSSLTGKNYSQTLKMSFTLLRCLYIIPWLRAEVHESWCIQTLVHWLNHLTRHLHSYFLPHPTYLPIDLPTHPLRLPTSPP